MGATTNGSQNYQDFGEWKKNAYKNSNKQRDQIFVAKCEPNVIMGKKNVEQCFGEEVRQSGTNSSSQYTQSTFHTAATTNQNFNQTEYQKNVDGYLPTQFMIDKSNHSNYDHDMAVKMGYSQENIIQQKSLYYIFNHHGFVDQKFENNLKQIAKYYEMRPCSDCLQFIGSYNLQYYFDSNILKKPQDNDELNHILNLYCDHSKCISCMQKLIKFRIMMLMVNRQIINFEKLSFNQGIYGQSNCCYQLIPTKLVQRILEHEMCQLYVTVKQYNRELEETQNNEYGDSHRYWNYQPMQKQDSEACLHDNCGIIHNPNQISCDLVAKWKRCEAYSKVCQNKNNDLSQPSMSTEVMGHLITDKETINYVLQQNILEQIGQLGIYVEKQNVENATWFHDQSYIHQIENKDMPAHTNDKDNYAEYSKQESTRLEWNYQNLMQAIQHKRHYQMTPQQQRTMLQWRQVLDNDQEIEVIQYSNNPQIQDSYLCEFPHSIWVARDVKFNQRPTCKIFRKQQIGKKRKVLVLVGTKQQIDNLDKILPKQSEQVDEYQIDNNNELFLSHHSDQQMDD